MARKQAMATGAEYKQFMNDENVWNPSATESWFLEEELVEVNGQNHENPYEDFGPTLEKLDDAAGIRIKGGFMMWQGKGADPTQGDGMSFAKKFDQWQKAKSTQTLTATFEVPRDTSAQELENLRIALVDLGAKLHNWPKTEADATPKNTKAPKA